MSKDVSARSKCHRDAAKALAVAALCLGPYKHCLADETAAIQIVAAVWTSGVDRPSRQHMQAYTSTAPVKPLYLWTQLRGSAEALDKLKRDGVLPIRHK